MTFEEIYQSLNQSKSKIDILESQLTALFSSMPDPIFIFDTAGNYINVLGGSAKHLYEDGAFLKGKNINEVFAPSTASIFQRVLKECLKSKSLQVFEYKLSNESFIQANNFQTLWFQGRVSSISIDSGDAAGVVWIAVNISEKKALENQLRNQANTDPLTEVMNRRAFNAKLHERLSLHNRYGDIFSFAILDIDYFKQVNDRYGHEAGDLVLKHFCQIVENELRENDVLARLGGEEFGLILPGTDIGGATVISERIRLAIENHPFINSKFNIPYTVSIGLSDVRNSDNKIEQVISRADEALYDAKQKGRNCLAHN